MESVAIKENSRKLNKVIVTGATGFIGFALVEKLSKMQVKVWAVVRENSKKLQGLQNLNNVEIVPCNLEHYDQLEQLIHEKNFDVFFHFAWQGVADRDSQDLEIQLSNVKYSCDAVYAAQKLSCCRFVFAASIMEYEVMKLMETVLIADKRNVYRTAKITAHYMTRTIANELKINYNAAIISNVFGKGETSNRFINSSLRNMLDGVRVKFTEAKQMYDFIYIDDAVEMLTLIAENGRKNKNYYIGSMEPRRLRDFIYEMRDCVDPSMEIGIGEYKEYIGVSLTYQEIDIKACYHDFGFVPRYSFQDGIRQTIEWMNG